MADDRTSEFRALAVSLSHELNDSQSLPIKRGKPVPIGGGRDNLNAELRRFHETASGISNDIAATSFLLAELTQLVKSSSALFSDDSQQVNSLVVRIKQSVENLNGRIDKADAFVQQRKRPLGMQAGLEASNLLIELKESFAHTTNSFKKVLEKRTDVMREASDQKKQIYGRVIDQVSLDNKPIVYGSSQPYSFQNVPTLDLTGAMNDGYPSGFNLPRPHGAAGNAFGAYKSPELRLRRSSADIPTFTSGTNIYPNRSDSLPLTPMDIKRMEEETGMQMQLIPDQNYLRDRADAMSMVESNIIELGTIFNRLAAMVSEHSEMVQRVEDNVEEANSTLMLSMSVLTDTLTNLKSNRTLMLKIFGVLVFFIITFIIFFA